jgi:hypothetical protein
VPPTIRWTRYTLRIGLGDVLADSLELAGNLLQRGIQILAQQLFADARPFHTDIVCKTLQRGPFETARLMQLIYHNEQDIQLAEGAKTRSNLPQPFAELGGGLMVELENRQ